MRTALQILFRLATGFIFVMFFSCETPEPVKEATPETITRLQLTFTPDGGGDPIIVEATDPDAEGVQEITATDSIRLLASVNYELQIHVFNELVEPAAPEYDITVEIEDEGVEHLLLFGWTENAFASPAGNGNIDRRNDDVVYLDADLNGLPLGLRTSWATNASVIKGDFRIVLKHQPDLKSENSGADTGETDLDFTFGLRID
jgi:hypothetical protein